MRLLATLLAAAVLASGCTAPADDHDDGHDNGGDGHGMAMGPGTYHMRLGGMPSGPMAPGQAFNVSVHAEMGAGMGMMRRTTDHIGAHFWNQTVADPTAAFGDSTACRHTGGELPGDYTAMCTAPMQPGAYHVRAHARMMDNGTTHHWWSDGQAFTVS